MFAQIDNFFVWVKRELHHIYCIGIN